MMTSMGGLLFVWFVLLSFYVVLWTVLRRLGDISRQLDGIRRTLEAQEKGHA